MKLNKKKIYSISLLLMFLLTGFYTSILMINSGDNSLKNKENKIKSDEINSDPDNDIPDTSIIGEDTWWSDNFNYCRIINEDYFIQKPSTNDNLLKHLTRILNNKNMAFPQKG